MGLRISLAGGAMALIRPKLLIAAARIGAPHYRRERDLNAAIGSDSDSVGRPIVRRLAAAERHQETLRRARSPVYRPGRHVQILSALIAEADQTKASGSEALRRST